MTIVGLPRNHPDYYKEYYRIFGRKRTARTIAARKKWDKEHRKEKNTHELVRQARLRGEIERPNSCQNCGRETRLFSHHPNYNQPLAVIFLCGSCHKKTHYLT